MTDKPIQSGTTITEGEWQSLLNPPPEDATPLYIPEKPGLSQGQSKYKPTNQKQQDLTQTPPRNIQGIFRK